MKHNMDLMEQRCKGMQFAKMQVLERNSEWCYLDIFVFHVFNLLGLVCLIFCALHKVSYLERDWYTCMYFWYQLSFFNIYRLAWLNRK